MFSNLERALGAFVGVRAVGALDPDAARIIPIIPRNKVMSYERLELGSGLARY